MRPYDFVLLPLQELLEKIGYSIKADKSSKHHITMHNNNGEILIITRKPNGHYLYFNPFNENDKGNIHHFCKARSLNAKRLVEGKELPLEHAILPTELNNKEIKASAEFKSFKNINLKSSNSAIRGNYLKKRGIKEEMFEKLNIKIDPKNNLCFPVYCYENKINPKDLTLCGYTAKLYQPLTIDKEGNDYKKPIKTLSYGKKGLEILKHSQLKSFQNIKKIIISETSIDSLSFLQLKGFDLKETLVCGTSGTITQNTQDTILFLLSNCLQANIFLGFDNDKQGQSLCSKLQEIIPNQFKIFIETPLLKDFNEDLQQLKQF